MASSDFSTVVQSLLLDIGYRYEPFPQYDPEYWGPFHHWMLHTLGPVSTWNLKQLTELEHSSGGIIERAYPHTSTAFKLIFAKLTAIAILIDDSIEDDRVNSEIVRFSHRLYLGEKQPEGMLELYHANMKELSDMYGDDTVLRGLAIVPWINYIDACLMEKQIFMAMREEVGANAGSLDGLAVKFPHYLRSKSGIAEAYAAGIFKVTKDQNIPISKYIRVLPDLTFFIEVMNDILSFYKEEMAQETYNLIHLRTRALSSTGVHGSGVSGDWTAFDTLDLLCCEIREATRRIDGLLRLDECERRMRGEDVQGVEDVDLEIARQWRGWRDGYVSWHLECRRYKLGFLKELVCHEEEV
ncbi:isoprenoid synthase domain-containing protein [Roridomyces roridus]|uniref:Isoprenoid synthase domain-containing protein n=1 Tax=Roridomyces roridus TaxID=1738132 RepID=A0AAD7C178_9AGAR|nr:isoprenoid synthase domain-containing protein [Roridomyces roridus]